MEKNQHSEEASELLKTLKFNLALETSAFRTDSSAVELIRIFGVFLEFYKPIEESLLFIEEDRKKIKREVWFGVIYWLGRFNREEILKFNDSEKVNKVLKGVKQIVDDCESLESKNDSWTDDLYYYYKGKSVIEYWITRSEDEKKIFMEEIERYNKKIVDYHQRVGDRGMDIKESTFEGV